VLADAFAPRDFQERQAEFVTDALRAQLLEWAGYRTKVFEFISTEHTAKNLMIAGIRETPTPAAPESGGDRARAGICALLRHSPPAAGGAPALPDFAGHLIVSRESVG